MEFKFVFEVCVNFFMDFKRNFDLIFTNFMIDLRFILVLNYEILMVENFQIVKKVLDLIIKISIILNFKTLLLFEYLLYLFQLKQISIDLVNNVFQLLETKIVQCMVVKM